MSTNPLLYMHQLKSIVGHSLLAMYDYKLVFQKTEAHGNADALSRLPLPEHPEIVNIPTELVLLLQHLKKSPITSQQIQL